MPVDDAAFRRDRSSGARGDLRSRLCVLLLPLGGLLTLAWLGLIAWLVVRIALDVV